MTDFVIGYTVACLMFGVAWVIESVGSRPRKRQGKHVRVRKLFLDVSVSHTMSRSSPTLILKGSPPTEGCAKTRARKTLNDYRTKHIRGASDRPIRFR